MTLGMKLETLSYQANFRWRRGGFSSLSSGHAFLSNLFLLLCKFESNSGSITKLKGGEITCNGVGINHMNDLKKQKFDTKHLKSNRNGWRPKYKRRDSRTVSPRKILAPRPDNFAVLEETKNAPEIPVLRNPGVF
jgi:hypothetical protein